MSLIHGLLELILSLSISTNLSKINPPPINRVLDSCLDFIRKHYEEDLSLSKICDECAVGRTTLFKLFRHELNCTPGEFIHFFRLQEGERLLRSTDLTVSQVVEKTGFTSPPGFYGSFKKRYGKSPSQYRRDFVLS